ncbi:MAG: protein kinase domain-containing protein [Bradymonadia bacterium]
MDDHDRHRPTIKGTLPPSVAAGSGTEVLSDASSDRGWDADAVLPIELPRQTAYEIESDLARGNMGAIQIARDLTLQRRVALKILDPKGPVPGAAARFLEEARITAQLAHPSIVPVHEIRMGDDDRPFFTMQLIEGRTLKAILDGVRDGDPVLVSRFSRVRLLNLFIQVCMAVAYAHNRGVIHRDLKPENIMLGEFGEVFVMDWGLAKIITTDVAEPMVGGRNKDESYRTRMGEITGTPAYMSPEQAMGLIDVLGPHSDIYSLGTVLYEILTGQPPHTGNSVQEILRRVRESVVTPPSEAAPEREIPPELDAVVLRCLARDPEARYTTPLELRDEIEAAMTPGSRTGMHRLRGTQHTLREAHRAMQQFRDLSRRRRRAAREFAEAMSERLPTDLHSEVERIWHLEDHLKSLRLEVDQAFEHAVSRYAQILAESPDHREAREGLRDIYWYRFLEAERLQDHSAMGVFKALAALHDPQGALSPALEGQGALVVVSDPPGAQMTLYRVHDEGRRQVPGHPQRCGPTPLALDPLPRGVYLAVLELEGYDTLRMPFEVGRQESVELRPTLWPIGALPEQMALIPGGPAMLGASARELSARPRARLRVETCMVAREPVTLSAYADFLNALYTQDPQSAAEHVPKGSDLDGIWQLGTSGRWYFTLPGPTPVTGINLASAEAYCRWRQQIDGQPWRLPREHEWEKAARGPEGRAYSWGDAWEPTFCSCAEGPEGGVLAPVGNPQDESPYGVRDMVGGIKEWTATAHPRDARHQVVKGGSFRSHRATCHLASRQFVHREAQVDDIGFRLALDPPPR